MRLAKQSASAWQTWLTDPIRLMISLTRNGPLPMTQAEPAEAQLVGSNAADRARDASVEARLTTGQKTALVLLARRAWERVRLVVEDIAGVDAWRQEQAVLACGSRISEARVKHFSMLKRHFADLAGKAGTAFTSAMREGTEAERIAMNTLERECASRGLRMDYPAAICRKQFKCSLQDCTAKQLWCLVFTVRKRRKPETSKEVKPTGAGQRSRDYTLKRPPSKPASQPSAETEEDPF